MTLSQVNIRLQRLTWITLPFATSSHRIRVFRNTSPYSDPPVEAAVRSLTAFDPAFGLASASLVHRTRIRRHGIPDASGQLPELAAPRQAHPPETARLVVLVSCTLTSLLRSNFVLLIYCARRTPTRHALHLSSSELSRQ